jgi:hypothetical protein
MVRIALGLGRVVLAIGFLLPSAVAQDRNSDETWKQFRKVYPYHIQTVAISQPSSSGHRILIIAEPPPHVTIANLRALDPIALKALIAKKLTIGYNGWAKDVVIDLPPMPADRLGILMEAIHTYLFGTTYKANVIPLPAKLPEFHQTNLNLHVPSEELDDWAVADNSAQSIGRSWTNIGAIAVLGFLCVWSLLRVVRPRRKVRHFLVLGISGIWLLILEAIS